MLVLQMPIYILLHFT